VKAAVTPRLLERSLRYALKLDETLAQMRQLALRDELTHLLNRREFQRMFEEEGARGVHFHRPFSLIMTDIDYFKLINDTHGHQVGDEVLRHVASLLAGQIRNVDRVARYGGEEFALIMVETNRATAMASMKRLGVLRLTARSPRRKNLAAIGWSVRLTQRCCSLLNSPRRRDPWSAVAACRQLRGRGHHDPETLRLERDFQSGGGRSRFAIGVNPAGFSSLNHKICPV